MSDVSPTMAVLVTSRRELANQLLVAGPAFVAPPGKQVTADTVFVDGALDHDLWAAWVCAKFLVVVGDDMDDPWFYDRAHGWCPDAIAMLPDARPWLASQLRLASGAVEPLLTCACGVSTGGENHSCFGLEFRQTAKGSAW